MRLHVTRSRSTRVALGLLLAGTLASRAPAEEHAHEAGEHAEKAAEPAGAHGEKKAPEAATYAEALHTLHAQHAAIDELIRTGKLDQVHREAAVIRDVAKTLPKLAAAPGSGVAKADIKQVNLTSKELAGTFGPIDEAADAGKKAETETVHRRMAELITTLEAAGKASAASPAASP